MTADSSDPTGGAAPDQRRRPTLTPYQATKQVNNALARAGVKDPRTGRPKQIGPPMLYIYAAKGKFERTRAPDGRWDLDELTFHEWLIGYVERAAERQQLREELDEDESV